MVAALFTGVDGFYLDIGGREWDLSLGGRAGDEIVTGDSGFDRSLAARSTDPRRIGHEPQRRSATVFRRDLGYQSGSDIKRAEQALIRAESAAILTRAATVVGMTDPLRVATGRQ